MTAAAAPRLTPRETVARMLYTALWFVSTPAIAAYLLWRSRRQPAYRRYWTERFLGRYATRSTRPCVWLHAVSVGETRAAAPLIAALRERHPHWDVLVTHMTPTGRETAEALYGDTVLHAYLAYDYPPAVAAFFRHWRPRLGIVMETEIWPNAMVAAARAAVPMVLANARLSEKSLRAAARWPALMRPAVRGFGRILAQTDADARRLATLAGTAASIETVGNVKFDVEPPPAQRELASRFAARLVEHPLVFLCASTREGEEDAILDAWTRHRHRVAAAGRVLLAIVPRHPQRFAAVFDAARTRGLGVQRRSDEAVVAADTDVWLGDSMGELWAYYLSAVVAYVGGSIAPLGGQNLIEAAAAACPVLVGPHTFNFAAATDDAVGSGAALRVPDYDALVRDGLALAADPERRRRMADAGTAFAAAHRGATRRSIDAIEEIFGSVGGSARISRP